MLKCGNFTYDGSSRFDAIKAIIIRSNKNDEIRYSFVFHYEGEDDQDPKNSAVISFAEHAIYDLFKCESSRDCEPGNIIFHNFKLGDSHAWDKMNTVLGHNILIKLGIDEVNITQRIYNFIKE